MEALQASEIEYENMIELSHMEIVREYEKCDILAFASIYEGFGMPIIEAQRVGRTVLTSSCSSMPEVGGEGACFVDPLNVSSIRDGFQRIILDEEYRESLIAAGFENAKRFDPDVIARQYLRVYHSTFGSNSR
jgi:glycosyltransferase involved in cell wall biosynthesis